MSFRKIGVQITARRLDNIYKPKLLILKMAKRRRVVARTAKTAKGGTVQSRISVTVKNLFLFLVLFAISLVFYHFSSTPLYNNLFWLLSIITGFLVFTFFIVLAVLAILKPKKR